MNNRSSAILTVGLLLSVAVYLSGYVLLEGQFVRHMLAHIIIMGPVACLCALALLRLGRQLALSRIFPYLWWATSIQILMFLVLHAPFVHINLHSLPVLSLTMAVMLGISTWYWCAVFYAGTARLWQAILTLLLTGKVFCMLAILIVFSPRALYSGFHHLVPVHEQQLAGLLMMVACPLSYVLTAVVLSARWLNQLERGVQTE